MSPDLASLRAVQSQNAAVASLRRRVEDAYSADGRRVEYDARDARDIGRANGWLTALYCALAFAVVARVATRRPRGPAYGLAAVVLAAALYPILVGPAERALYWAASRAAEAMRYALFV